MNRKVFVSRANSYLNTHIVTYLLEHRIPCVLGLEVGMEPISKEHLSKICQNYDLTPEIRTVDYSVQLSVTSAIEDCDVIIHSIASDEWYETNEGVECYKTAISETLLLMQCASNMQIRRLILSSSLVSVYGGIDKSKIEVTDTDWGNIYNLTAQSRAYLYTERAVWSFNQHLPTPLQVTVLNLATLFGPSLSNLEKHSSVKFMLRVLNGAAESLLQLKVPFVDVRDAALIHVLIIDKPESFEQRYNVCQGCYWMNELAETINDEFKFLGLTASSSFIGAIPVKLASLFSSNLKPILFHCGKDLKISSFRIRQVVQVKLRAFDESILDMAYTLIDRGQVKKEIDIIKNFSKPLAKEN